MRFLRVALFILLLIAANGCGTTTNLALHKAKPFGGVKLDAIVIGNCFQSDEPAAIGLGVAAAIDMPMTIVGDTLTASLVMAGR